MIKRDFIWSLDTFWKVNWGLSEFQVSAPGLVVFPPSKVAIQNILLQEFCKPELVFTNTAHVGNRPSSNQDILCSPNNDQVRREQFPWTSSTSWLVKMPFRPTRTDPGWKTLEWIESMASNLCCFILFKFQRGDKPRIFNTKKSCFFRAYRFHLTGPLGCANQLGCRTAPSSTTQMRSWRRSFLGRCGRNFDLPPLHRMLYQQKTSTKT